MKNMKKILVLIVLFSGFAASSFAQSEATATANATMITPISISKINNMNFGTLAASATEGTVVLSAEASATRTPDGGVTLHGGTVTAAKFTVTGAISTNYTITIPSAAFPLTGAGTPMSVDTWISDPDATGNTGAGGTQDIYVGATLHVNANQVAGVYTSAAFPVTVNYE
jgi:hypothetical protein